jgi:hypothetical protein
MWKNSVQQVCYLAALLTFYAHDKLIAADELQALTGLSLDQSAAFHIDVEDFLVGLCSVSQELVCSAVPRD